RVYFAETKDSMGWSHSATIVLKSSESSARKCPVRASKTALHLSRSRGVTAHFKRQARSLSLRSHSGEKRMWQRDRAAARDDSFACPATGGVGRSWRTNQFRFVPAIR